MILGMEGMILRIKREWMMIKGKREDDDRGGREWDRRERLRGCEGTGKKGDHWRRRSFMEEEKGKEIQGGKRRRG